MQYKGKELVVHNDNQQWYFDYVPAKVRSVKNGKIIEKDMAIIPSAGDSTEGYYLKIDKDTYPRKRRSIVRNQEYWDMDDLEREEHPEITPEKTVDKWAEPNDEFFTEHKIDFWEKHTVTQEEANYVNQYVKYKEDAIKLKDSRYKAVDL